MSSGQAQLMPHQQRVVDEKADVDGKLERLSAFIHGPTFETIDPAEQSRLKRQQSIMVDLSLVLGERIEAFQP